MVALKHKMDLSVGITIGSSLQIALFVAPLLVFLSYYLGRTMDLEFSLPEVFAVAPSVYILFRSAETEKRTGLKACSFSRST